MDPVYVVGMARSPVFSVELGKNDGPNTSSVSGLLPQDLAAQVLKSLLIETSIDPWYVDFFYLGSAISQKVEPSLFQAPAKFVFRKRAELGMVRALGRTVEKACSTGLSAIWSGTRKILVGKADIVVAGGMDMMSRQKNDVIIRGLTDPRTQKIMAQLADEKAIELGITREMHDVYALESYQFAAKHLEDHKIVPIRIGDNSVTVISLDEEVVKKASRIKDAHFRRSPTYPGCTLITPLNSSKYGDAAAFIVLASEKAIRDKNLKPLARIVAFAESSERESKDFIIAPVNAVRKALDDSGLTVSQIDYWENNEAFATVPLNLMKKLGIPREIMNPWGGAIAHGHPIGATGGVLTVKHLQILEKEQKRYGAVVICNATSEATAMIFEREV
ncbi:MAG: hypothetical protein A3B91_03000 [Candidatus Yanofskybacteria bacterium RIFCSPHIGHO2_02_FULL_41_29]|uniref:Acetyl-CoA acetyltransferase n=1 Tax=Candidatus Yanofskybacteria bacterium RIFCSPHIGHO2_01_FULL_41_53 TaxID=1802663 RepID=A0A1F8EG74_9BACT|nr:MAG: hypothetical protein A2650_00155 [Candidatus Yanofskybacteria bacterium RIFCSPHIGHO2_01_FULL_41_53]OGN11115.1 MAG: hypothetical protein A3B91_03000 [Candidatus Yanofskybacteria bacterium RIFCSPHIGHO2_02_FULL_41_29]OGN22041.1 MAG: hypothetical protein A2916_00230 [Candidatus Yanofskybacteria bacterium RIFCSPLOWO2_01_FULL_41_67]OGN29326.1 MAG: hypothetical protein A3H54_03115 [Candidatus Yanofskybacteria bacterium RIFCSPLOWO2_02_FULL_41_13]OGN33397.1 MAG: hypothetical protein A3F98_00655 